MASRSVATIGFFDGIHKGHQEIIKRTVQIAVKKDLKSIAITFDQHPPSVLSTTNACLLVTPDEKVNQIKKLGVDQVVVIEFNEKFASLSPAAFIRKVLLPLRVCHVVVGEGFRFGRGRRGDLKFLQSYGERHGIDLTIQPLLRVDSEKISSSHIRSLLKQGRIDKVHGMLGRPPTFKGHVIRGTARGKKMGFPSANIELDEELCLPKIGAYAGYLRIGHRKKRCLINWGYAPTFGERKKPLLEAHCFDLDEELYSKQVEVELILRLRGEIAFPSEEALVKQLKKDAKRAKNMLRW